MRKLYLIAYDQKLDRDALTKFLDGRNDCGPWLYSLPNAVFVFSKMTAFSLYDAINNRFPSHGRFFVTEVPLRNAQGWLPGNHWNLINSESIVHDYKLEFEGYWREGREDGLPKCAGVYCVYAATYNKVENTVSLHQLLYIGKSEDVHERHRDHEAKPRWKRKLSDGQILCYSMARLAKQSLSICEAAMIKKHQPPCNELLTDQFPHGATHIVTIGRNALLSRDFVVR